MVKKIKNMAELNKHINKILVDSLNKENNLVANEIKYTEAEMVEQEVYAKYAPDNGEPFVYQRRGDKGGLADVSNMEHTAQKSKGKVSMNVRNMTPPNPKFNDNQLKDGEVADLVENGDGANGLNYSYPDGSYADARPFQSETVEELKNNKKLRDALKIELRKKGIKTINM